MTIVFCHPLPPYLCLSIILYVIADNCSFHDRHKYIHEPLLVPLACSPSGRRAFQSLASPPTPLTQALKMVDLDAIRFANPFTYLSKDMEGPYIVRAMLRGPSFTGEKGAANLRRLGYTPAVVTGIFGKTEHTPIAIEAKHFERLHRHLGDTLGCTPIRLAFDFELPTLREEGEGNGAGDVSSSSPFAPPGPGSHGSDQVKGQGLVRSYTCCRTVQVHPIALPTPGPYPRASGRSRRQPREDARVADAPSHANGGGEQSRRVAERNRGGRLR